MGFAHDNLRRRRLYRVAERAVGRPATRTVVRGVSRSILREAWRTVLPYEGPSLNDICSLLNAYVRLAEKHERKKKQRQPKFETLCTPEESHRKFLADLERCYGAGAQLPDAEPKFAHTPPAPAVSATPPVPPSPVPAEKKDIVAVPLVYTGGLLSLDWSRAK
jgi:hypothetical protein